MTPCGTGISLVTINTTPQSNQIDDDYSGAEKVFTYNPFTIVPDYCGVVVTCKSVAPVSLGLPCQPLDSEGKLKWTFTEDTYKNKLVAPDTYTFTYDVCDNLDSTNCEQFTVVIDLTDPCNGEIVTTKPDGTQTIEYIISDQ